MDLLQQQSNNQMLLLISQEIMEINKQQDDGNHLHR